MLPGHPSDHTTSFCAAEWFDVHRAFNRSQTAVNQNATIEMLPPTLASSPNLIRLRFKVVDPDGIHHVHLNKEELSDRWLIGCNRLEGTHSSIVEFVTDYLKPKTDHVQLHVMDVHGNIERSQSYPIDIVSLLPRAKVVSIPDAGLAAAIRREIGNSITTHTMLNLNSLFAQDEVIIDLTGLEHAHNLRQLSIYNRISDLSVLAGLTKLSSFVGSVSDVSALPRLPNLRSLGISGSSVSDVSTLSRFPKLIWLYLERNGISDVSSLSELTQLNLLNLSRNNISDISALSGLTQLKWLYLKNNNISDISSLSGLAQLTELNVRENPLSYASIHTHIPAMQARGVEVKFNKRTHPVLVKISGDDQVGEVRTTLANPFVVEAVNQHGNPMKGVLVTFTVSSGGETLNPTTATTNAKGRARTTLRLGSALGMNTVTVTAKGIRSSVTFTAHATGPPIYWIDTTAGTLHRLVGTEVENLALGVRNATNLAIDVTSSKLYWTERTSDKTGKIRRANLDGTNIQLIKDLTSVPHGVALDLADGKIYLTSSRGKVQRLNIDGSNFEPNLITGLEMPESLALDISEGKIYWTEVSGRIRRANLDGSDVEDVATGLGTPMDLAVFDGTVYWTEMTGENQGEIQRVNLDGTNTEMLLTLKSISRGIALAPMENKLYWTNSRGKIQRANLDGSNIETLITGLVAPSDLMLQIFAPLPPATVVADERVPMDVNADGIVNIQDLVLVASGFGQTGQNAADVNGDGIVNIQDLVLVAGAFGNGVAAAPGWHLQAIDGFTASDVQDLLMQARQMSLTDPAYLRGIAVLEQLLASLLPKETALLSNYPNPFNPETWIPYQLAKPADVALRIHATNGVLVRTLVLGHQPSGIYQSRSRAAYWDGKNELGEKVASGIYFYTLSAGDFTATRKMLIMK